MPETLLEPDGPQSGVFRREPPTQPYPGLRSFGRNEAALFFGRKKSVGRLLEILQRTRFLAVLGPSGSGKSSLVRTGLFEALEGGLDLIAGSRWTMVDIAHPADRPFHALAGSMLQATTGEETPGKEAAEALAQDLRRGPRSLIEWSQAGGVPAGHNLLVLVDQFEEMFRSAEYATREEVEAFVELLIESSRSAEAPIYVVMTMRSEYVGAGSQIHNLGETMTRGMYITPWMTRHECELAITGPAKLMGFSIEPGLVNRLLNDIATFAPQDDDAGIDAAELMARQSDQLPLMQHLLNLLWREGREAAPAGKLTLRRMDYDQLGGLSGAMDVHAERVFNALGKDARKVAEDVFRAIITGSSVATAVRRPRRFGDLVEECACDPALVVEVVEAFRAPDCSFLTPPPPARLTDDLIIDISHESIIRQWARLRGWIDAEATAASLWPLLLTQAREHREKKGEVLTGRTLELRDRWWSEDRPNRFWASRYGGDFDLVKDYMEVSRIAERRRRLKLALIPVGVVVGMIAIGLSILMAALMQTAALNVKATEEELRFVQAKARSDQQAAITRASEAMAKRARDESRAAEAKVAAAEEAALAVVRNAERERLALARDKAVLTEEKSLLVSRVTELRGKNAVWQRNEVAVAAANFDTASMNRVAEEARASFEEGELGADDHGQVIWSWVVSGQADEILGQGDKATAAFAEAFRQAEQTRVRGLDSASLRRSRALANSHYALDLLRSGGVGSPASAAKAREALSAADACVKDVAGDDTSDGKILLIQCWEAVGLAKAHLGQDFDDAFSSGRSIGESSKDINVARAKIQLSIGSMEAIKISNEDFPSKREKMSEYASDGLSYQLLAYSSITSNLPSTTQLLVKYNQHLGENQYDSDNVSRWSEAFDYFSMAELIKINADLRGGLLTDGDESTVPPVITYNYVSLLNSRLDFGDPNERLQVSLSTGSTRYYKDFFGALSQKLNMLNELPALARAGEADRAEAQFARLSEDIRSPEFRVLLSRYPGLLEAPNFLEKSVKPACRAVQEQLPILATRCAEIQSDLAAWIPDSAADRASLQEGIAKAKGQSGERLWKRDDNEVALDGYDVVAYFKLPADGQAVMGQVKYAYVWQGAVWLFSSQDNLDRFREEPGAFAPQYAGGAAELIRYDLFQPSDPRAWRVLDGKLYLLGRIRSRDLWDATRVADADAKWPKVRRDAIELPNE